MSATWCTIHQRDFAADTDLDGNPWGCCSLCAAALMLAEEDTADDDGFERMATFS